MTTDWPVKPLVEVVDILDRLRVPINSKERAARTGDIPYYGATGQTGWINDYIFDEELVLLGEDGAPFTDHSKPTAYLISGKAWVNNHAHVLRAKSCLSNRFLLHYLNQLDYTPYISGTTRAKLPQGPMKQIPIPVPSLSRQMAIVAEIETQLSRLDETVGTLQGIQAKLKQARASILKAAVEGRLVETGGETPWIRKPLRELISEPMRNGKSAKASPNSKGVRIATLTAVTANQFTEENTKTAELDPAELHDLWMQPGDIFVQRSNAPELVGISAMYSGKANWAIFPDLMIRVRCSHEILPKWMLANLQSPITRSFFKENAKGSSGSMPKISQTVIGAALITCPSLQAQETTLKEAYRRLSVLDQVETTMKAGIARCGYLRQAILKKAFQV